MVEPLLGVISDSARDGLVIGMAGGGAPCDGQPVALRPPPRSLAEAIVRPDSPIRPSNADSRGRSWPKSSTGLRHPVHRFGGTRILSARGWSGRCVLRARVAPWDYEAGRIIADAAGAEVLQVPAAHGQGPAVVAAHPGILAPLTELLYRAGALTD